MEKEKGPGGAQNLDMWEKALKEIGAPKKHEVYIKNVYAARNRFDQAYGEKDQAFLTEVDNVKTLIKKEAGGPEDPIIRGPVEIAKGEKLILGITPDQKDAFAIIYGMDLNSKISYYALIENVAKESEGAQEVLIKFCDIKPASVDHLIISEALARKLQIKENQHIGILSVYQKRSDINLDKI